MVHEIVVHKNIMDDYRYKLSTTYQNAHITTFTDITGTSIFV